MKKYTVFLPLFILFFSVISAQEIPPSIQWQKCLGGTGDEHGAKVFKTSDGGYIVGGVTNSFDGDVTSHATVPAFWLVKLTATGAISWQKIYGHKFNHRISNAMNFTMTPDGGYIIAGTISGNDPAFSGYHGKSDVLIIKVTQDGTVEWQKCYGGSEYDGASGIESVSDGYIFTASTNSIDGDVTTNNGNVDLWVVKLDFQGKIKWQKSLGGSESEMYAASVIQTSDKGYIIVTTTGSMDGDVSGHHAGEIPGIPDAWVIKLDSTGNKQWQKCYGGSGRDNGKNILQLADGGYLLLAEAGSLDGDLKNGGIHEDDDGTPEGDIWVLKLNTDGGIISQKCYGGSDNETASFIAQAPDGNFIVGGSAQSTDGDVTGVRMGNEHWYSIDAWLLKINESGTLLWQKTFGGNSTDVILNFIIDDDNELLFIAHTQSSNGYDISGSHNKVNNVYAIGDIWMVKTGGVNIIEGTAYIDYNANGVKDGNDEWVKNALVKTEKPGINWQTEIDNGSFRNQVDTGKFVTSLVLPNPYYTVVPETISSTFLTLQNTDSISFSVVPKPGNRNYTVRIIPETPARPGFNAYYRLMYRNSGTDILKDKTLTFIKDSRATMVHSSLPPVTISGDTLTWNIALLEPENSGFISLNFLNSSAELEIGDTLFLKAFIDSTGDLSSTDNFALLRQQVTGSYDPNDKQENSGGFLEPDDIATGRSLIYTIRFQNTGNDTAFNIVVRDTLDAATDWNSIQMVHASHPYKFTIKNNNKLTWTFTNIRLVDSVRNEPKSHGYITYRIKPKSTLIPGNVIKNSASIYFDFNQPVKTNTHLTTVKTVPPPTPSFSGLLSSYCKNVGIQKGKITNFPATGIAVTVKLDGTVLPVVAADSSFSFTPTLLGSGNHSLNISFSNLIETKVALHQFTITETVIPDVNLTANMMTVTNPSDLLEITAVNVEGGGTSPQYTFAKDRLFTVIIQAESVQNKASLSPANLSIGLNRIYVRMKTSESCYRSQTTTDSINIERRIAGTGITDPDFPGQPINVYPNPFDGVINIQGLSAEKEYTVILFNQDGRKILSLQVNHVKSVELHKGNLSSGKYLVTIFDKKKNRRIGTVSLIRK